MPMYRGKPFEARLAGEENAVDIAHWCGLDEDEIQLGFYYEQPGLSTEAEWFEAMYENCDAEEV